MQEPRTPDVETTISVEEEVSKPSERVIEIVTETFQALGDVTRVKILYALQQRTMCVREIAYQVGISESAVSHQLRLLRDRRLVRRKRQSNKVYYSLDDHHLPVMFREAEYHADHILNDRPNHPYP
ncbi:ArsR/SmtB family transcription factor [Ktedonobacter racemifer]|uniref:Transcriptional regulator, ArsR family n=1 Tax=Ktedonobacter racemifer DSM 44963 TaxID=485913 RepID=D6TIN5_KTERA|nr:metalloregulator ArsR/SmtB family transcription factor [Ktedonobacter racemifer]EFH89292.1 transcriptional regulator, ArsR family [Ktedonobacter racemifer DSM 44963]